MTNESFYDPNHPPSWDAEVSYEFVNLTAEQIELAKSIIDENKVIPIGFINVLNALSKAGFRGNVVSRPLFEPPLIVINSKVEMSDMTKNEFKIGDRVRIKDHPSVNPDYVGRICEVASVDEGAYITFKDCDSYWNPEVLELVEPLDRKTAFLTELQALLKSHNATIQSYMSGVDTVGLCICFGDENIEEVDYQHNDTICEINADNIMDFDKE